jgi:nucleotide-binding universal stress UspA family protein
MMLDVVEKAVELGEHYDARYRFLAVIHHPSGYMDSYLPEVRGMDERWVERARKEATMRLEREAERLESRRLDVEVRVVQARSPAVGILDAAVEWGADLIAMGTHGRSGVSRMLLGSVSDKVVRSSDRPVLLYRPSGP